MAIETEFSAAAHRLLDPPVIPGAHPSAAAAADGAPASHPFLHLLDAAFNAAPAEELKATLKPQRVLTENCSTAGKEGVEVRDRW
jgi:hypothetical protein